MAEEGRSGIINLEAIILEWAQEIFEKTMTKTQSNIKKEYLQFTINWKSVVFNNFEEKSNDVVPVALQGGQGAKRNILSQVLFQAVFKNTTNRDQDFTFKTQRTTRSSLTITLEQGVSLGFEMGLQLKLPLKIVELLATYGFKAEIITKNISSEVIEEELTWGVDSTIKVPRETEMDAQLVVEEEQYHGAFTMRTDFYGKVIVSVTNGMDNNSLVTIVQGSIGDIMKNKLSKGVLHGLTVVGDVASYETCAKYHFKSGVRQIVCITELPLSL